MADDSAAATDDLASLPRKPGRRKGLPRVPGSGRKPGQANHVNRDIRELIITRGQPIEFLCDVVKGRKVRVGPQAGPGEPIFVYPELADRIKAAGILTAKVVPDMKALEATVTGTALSVATALPVAQPFAVVAAPIAVSPPPVTAL